MSFKTITVYIIVEGKTELSFITQKLTSDFGKLNIYLLPTIIGKPNHKGGNVNFERFANDFKKFLKQNFDTYISTMFDLYGLDSDWPGLKELKNKLKSGLTMSAHEKAEFLEKKTL